jgi:6-phosphofructokinase 1
LSFGYNSALSFAVELLGRIRIAALDTRRIAVVEVPGHHAGWLALQAGMAVCCDAVLIPEVPYDLKRVAQSLREQEASGRRVSLVVVAEGAVALRPSDNPSAVTEAHLSARRASLSPLSDPLFGEGDHVIERAGRAAESVALNLQRLTGLEMVPFAIGQLVRGGSPTAVDRQLGLGSGAGAVRALESGRIGVMVAFQPPDLTFVPLVEALNRIRSVPMESELIHIARGLGISLGD